MTPLTGTRAVPRFAIGTRFVHANGHRESVVQDILRTYNAKGELVRIRYVAVRTLAGMPVTDYDMLETTIAKGLVPAGDTNINRGEE